ncbi:MAG TPA: protease pro-enzyme activation domain-containing protein [Streptosporangiaceae bacterium]|nr:protease pro-enzyme activation domain-containing protein [Streptosporangiaceae bacterium]
MKRVPVIAVTAAAACLVPLAAASPPATASAAVARPPSVYLAGSVAPFASHAKAIGDVAGSRKLSIQVWLRPRLAAAQDFAMAVSTPGSPLFHHYLSPAGYSRHYGATRGEASKVESWLRAEGFAGVRADSRRSYVRGTATVAKIDAAFGVRLKLYRASASVSAGAHPLRANDRPVSVPASLARSVLGVTGLDNAAPIFPLAGPGGVHARGPAQRPSVAAGGSAPCSNYYGQFEASGLPEQFGVTAFPTEQCGYTARQLRAVYGANAVNTGASQTVALVELGLTPDMFLTLQDYARVMGIPAPVASHYAEVSVGRGSACGDPANIEEQLDVEAVYDMATSANELVIGGDSCDNGDFGLQGLFNADQAVLDGAGNHPLASIASNSWDGGGEAQPAALTMIEHSFLVQAAAEGVGMYFSSGDGSGTQTPANDPFAIAVGGTTLGIGQHDNRLFETGWSTGLSVLQDNQWVFQGEQGASGGGPSVVWPEPDYQKPVVPSALTMSPGASVPGRVVPDISADADSFTAFATGLLTFDPSDPSAPPTFGFLPIGGTSLATPLVAGMVAAAQQGQPEPFGLVNPAIYKMAGTSAVHDVLPFTAGTPALFRGIACVDALCGGQQLLTTFDDQDPAMLGYTGQVTLQGYDNMTGIGTPNGQYFIKALRNLEN